jgi:hypothetical protein
LIRNSEGAVTLARLGARTLMAEWHKRQLDHEISVEWRLTLDGEPLAIRDRSGAPTVIALHRWDEEKMDPRPARRREDGRWEIEVPMAWHTMCVSVSGVLRLEVDEEAREVLLSDELEVSL